MDYNNYTNGSGWSGLNELRRRVIRVPRVRLKKFLHEVDQSVRVLMRRDN